MSRFSPVTRAEPDAIPNLVAYFKHNCVDHGDFTLKSGAKSTFYIDARRAVMDGPGLHVVGRALFQPLWDYGPHTVIAGVAEGGIPLVAAALMVAVGAGRNYHGCWIRRDVKEHGKGGRIAGHKPAPGCPIVLLEDVVTTGGSALEAIQALQAEGYRVDRVISLLHRGSENNPFAVVGIPYWFLMDLKDLGLASVAEPATAGS